MGFSRGSVHGHFLSESDNGIRAHIREGGKMYFSSLALICFEFFEFKAGEPFWCSFVVVLSITHTMSHKMCYEFMPFQSSIQLKVFWDPSPLLVRSLLACLMFRRLSASILSDWYRGFV